MSAVFWGCSGLFRYNLALCAGDSARLLVAQFTITEVMSCNCPVIWMWNEIGSIGRLVLEVGLNESALERGLLFFVLIREGYRVLQIPELRQHFSPHYSKTLSTGPAGNRIPAYRSTVENLSYRANQVAIYPSLKELPRDWVGSIGALFHAVTRTLSFEGYRSLYRVAILIKRSAMSGCLVLGPVWRRRL